MTHAESHCFDIKTGMLNHMLLSFLLKQNTVRQSITLSVYDELKFSDSVFLKI